MVDMDAEGTLENRFKGDVGFFMLITAEKGKEAEDEVRKLANRRIPAIIGENLKMATDNTVTLESFDVKGEKGDKIQYEVTYSVGYTRAADETRKQVSANRAGNIASVLEKGEPFDRYRNYFHSRTFIEKDDKSYLDNILVWLKCF